MSFQKFTNLTPGAEKLQDHFLATFDVAAAKQAAEKAREYNTSPALLATMVEPHLTFEHERLLALMCDYERATDNGLRYRKAKALRKLGIEPKDWAAPQEPARVSKATYARIRIETLEDHLGLHLAKGDLGAAEAIRYLVRDLGITLDATNVEASRERVAQELARR